MLAPESFFGPYRLIARLGAGGMGEVWKAEDTRLGRIVAIKVLSQTFALDAEAAARLKREARTAAQLYHPNIAMIHSIEQDGDTIFIVMEYVEGDPLTKTMARGAMTEAEICRIGKGVAEALAEAHEKGIVHRDIKPDNIIVTATRVKVLDFGIAKKVGVETTSSNAPTAFVTQQGMILGTVHYMSPEQALGKELDGRTDIFSLGVVLYEAATGKLPFEGDTVTETMMHIIRDEAPDPGSVNPKISPGLKSIIDRCLHKKREERFANAAELAQALDQQLGKAATSPYTQQTVTRPPTPATEVMTELRTPAPAPPPKKSSPWLWITLVVILLAAAIVGAIAMRPHKPAPAPAPPQQAAVAQPTTTVATTTTTAATTTAQSSQPPSTSSVSVEETQPADTAPKLGSAAEAPQSSPAAETPSSAPDVDALYQHGVSQLASGDKPEARKTFLQIVRQDPENAKAHFRLGEIALLNHNLGYAQSELEMSWAQKEKMDPHERHITRLGLAICHDNREEARRVVFETERLWPGDPDLEAIRRAYPPEERPAGGRGRRFRP